MTYRTASGPLPALRDVSFTVGAGELVCVVGPSGCGKTTLLKLLAGLLTPSSGSVVTAPPPPGRPANALMFQEHALFPWMTVLENVTFALDGNGAGRRGRLDRAREFVERVGLTQFGAAYPHQLSAGMRQRVALARVLARNPYVWLMDEPFGALDGQTRLLLQEELLRTWEAHQQSILFVTHDIDEGVRLADRILVMTGRPGTMREQVVVTLPRPRQPLVGDGEAAEIKCRIWRLLEDEVRKTLYSPRAER